MYKRGGMPFEGCQPCGWFWNNNKGCSRGERVCYTEGSNGCMGF